MTTNDLREKNGRTRDTLTLGLDAATSDLGIAIVGSDGLVCELTLQGRLMHSEGLLPSLDDLLTRTHHTVEDIGGVAVTLGPGSFTSVRIGLATAKGICLGRDIPLAGISALRAASARFPFSSHPVATWFDARREEVYAGLYDTSTGTPVSIEDDAVVDARAWLESHTGQYVFAGDGASAYSEIIREIKGDEVLIAPNWVPGPCAGAVAAIGRKMIERGETIPVDDVAPVYLRRPEAVRKRVKSDRAG
jgi:tRNA threonylcarbamoyladenosine biosynthesis protein TsaB